MKEGERAARAQGTQGIGDDIAAAEPGPGFHETPPKVNRLARRVIEAAVEVHWHLGPGYAEAVYDNALAIELDLRGIPYQRQATFDVPVLMRGVKRVVLNRPRADRDSMGKPSGERA